MPEISGPTEGSGSSAAAQPDEDIVDLGVAAKRLRISRQTLTKAVISGQVPALKAGRIYRLHWPTVMAIMTGSAPPPTPSTSGSEHDNPGSRDR